LAGKNNQIDIEPPEKFANRVNLIFTDKLLLSRALTHRSYLNEHPEAIEDNERLEFLGDAVLDFLVASWLYHRFPEMAEGDLTRMRSALVHTDKLAQFARSIDLGQALRLGRGEIQNGGANRSALLCDSFEALVGALFLDANLESVTRFMHPFLEEEIQVLLTNLDVTDPKSLLQEWVQGQGMEAPRYITKSSSGPEHRKTFEVEVIVDGKVLGSGEGYSKQTAEKNAAKSALINFGIH
jgi:ribonuclease-3